jgi:hypothetical protein
MVNGRRRRTSVADCSACQEAAEATLLVIGGSFVGPHRPVSRTAKLRVVQREAAAGSRPSRRRVTRPSVDDLRRDRRSDAGLQPDERRHAGPLRGPRPSRAATQGAGRRPLDRLRRRPAAGSTAKPFAGQKPLCTTALRARHVSHLSGVAAARGRRRIVAQDVETLAERPRLFAQHDPAGGCASRVRVVIGARCRERRWRWRPAREHRWAPASSARCRHPTSSRRPPVHADRGTAVQFRRRSYEAM